VWFGEEVESRNLVACADAIDHCQLMMVVGHLRRRVDWLSLPPGTTSFNLSR
jgi:hypothetical protein